MTQPPPAQPDPGGTPARSGCAPWLMGCGVVLVILLLAGGAAAWWFVGRPLQEIRAAAQDAERIQELDARVTDRSSYAAPSDGELSEEQVTRYLAVLRRVRDDLEGRYRTLEARYAEIDGRRPQWTELPRLAGAYADFLGLLVSAKESQVEALNAEGFSLEEYAWVRREVLRAAGLPGLGYDLSGFVDAVTEDRDPRGDTAGSPPPESNRDLVEQRSEELEELAFLPLLGL